MERLFVVDGDFFVGFDVSQSEEQDVAVGGPHVRVRLTGMIYVMSSVTAARAIQTPAPVDIADAQEASLARALLRFQVRN